MDVRETLVELRKEAAHYAICICSAFQHCEDCPYRKYGTDCRDNIEMDFLIKKGVTVQEWISVKDRLPETTIRCIVSKHNVPFLAYWDGEKWRETNKLMVVDGVTHWMPIPQPPNGE